LFRSFAFSIFAVQAKADLGSLPPMLRRRRIA
jgi:hypothetical protein